jgi:hypothetical protein
MGTGIVANAGANPPFDVPGLKQFCLVVWLTVVVRTTHATARRALACAGAGLADAAREQIASQRAVASGRW